MYKNAGKKLRDLRNKNRLSQRDLSEILGVSKNYLSTVERGEQKGSLEMYRSAVEYFKVSFDYFLLDELSDKRNMYIDTVMLKMKYMDESGQKLVLKIVEDILECQDNKQENDLYDQFIVFKKTTN